MAKITQRLIFPELFEKPIHYQFDEPHGSCDGGALLLKAADQKLQLTAALADCLVDGRQAAKVKHSLEDLLRQRIYGLASGYADANDAARLANDPIFKVRWIAHRLLVPSFLHSRAVILLLTRSLGFSYHSPPSQNQ